MLLGIELGIPSSLLVVVKWVWDLILANIINPNITL